MDKYILIYVCINIYVYVCVYIYRTEAGKSSVLMALFRLVELAEVRLCIYIYSYVCVYIYVYIYIYIYIYTHI